MTFSNANAFTLEMLTETMFRGTGKAIKYITNSALNKSACRNIDMCYLLPYHAIARLMGA